VSGVAWNVQLVPLQVTGEDGKGNTSSLALAINWAINNNIDIINMSIGTYDYTDCVNEAIHNYMGLSVAAAWNDKTDTDTKLHYPSSYSFQGNCTERVISVGAIDTQGNLWNSNIDETKGTNYGIKSVSLFAVGESVPSTVPSHINAEGYSGWSGTSMVAPYVTGTAQPKMNQEKMNSILIPIPPTGEQLCIVQKINQIFPVIENM